MTALAWQRYELPPWERQRAHTSEYGLDLGDDRWIICRRVYHRAHKLVVWQVFFAPCALKGPRPSIVVLLFNARTSTGAKALAELWWSTNPPQGDIDDAWRQDFKDGRRS